MGANVNHSSPQRTTHGKRRKSQLKTIKRLRQTQLVLNNLK